MLLREYFTAWFADWTGRMSGGASVVLALWAAFFPPTIQQARWALITAALTSFILGSYHIWAKERRRFEAEKEKHERYKIIFKLNPSASKASFKDEMLVLTISVQFENKDIYPWSMQELDFNLHKLGKSNTQNIFGGEVKDVFTMMSCIYKSKGGEVPQDQFEGQLIQAGTVSPVYEAILLTHIIDKSFEGFENLSNGHFIRVSMEASNQPTFTRDLFLARLI